MKKINLIQLLIMSTVLLTMTLFSCKDKDETPPASTTGSFMFHLHTMADSNEVESYGDTLVMTGGRQIIVTTAQLYISNIKLIKTDGTAIDGPSAIIFMKQGVEEYDLGMVPAGNYKSVRFDVGLSDAVNTSTPLSNDQTLFQPSMWFGATAQPDGFVFINFQGSIDTTDAGNGTTLIPFKYKIGTSSHRTTLTMPDQNYTITPNQQTVIHLEVDYAKLLKGVKLNTNVNLNITTAAENSGFTATQIATNIADIFDYE